MSNCQLQRFEDTSVQFIDGDRGVNYPNKSELLPNGHCLFLNTGNVTNSGFIFDSVDFITTEKDEQLRKGKASRGDVIMTTRGTVGNVAFYSHNIPFDHIRINSGMIIVRPDTTEYIPYFLYLFFRSALFKKQCFTNGSGSAQPQLPISALRNISLPKIDINTQKTIVCALKSIDDKIELNNKINTELEAMAKLVYDYWFVQFDFPDENGKPYKSSGGKMVYNEELKREIPDGWSAGNIMNLTNLLGGGTPKTTIKKYWSGSIPFFTPADAESNVFSLETKASITVEGLQSCSSRLYSKGTVFITARGTVGKINIASCDMAMSQSCYALQGKNGVSSEFVYFYVDELVHYIKSKASGSIFKALVTNDFKFTAMTIPPTALINKFTKVSGPIFEKLLINKIENNNLIELRDWLLPMLMNGQVSID